MIKGVPKFKDGIVYFRNWGERVKTDLRSKKGLQNGADFPAKNKVLSSANFVVILKITVWLRIMT